MNAHTPKGFRDFLPLDALKRQYVLGKIVKVFQSFGFDPLETPTLEYAQTLKGKYGEEERLIYQFKTLGGDEVALKYDQTVPLARVVAQYGPNGEQKLAIPFKRYQIQAAFRGENTQKGRYREFLQCDADTIGVSTILADTEILALVYEIYKNIGLNVTIAINDRSILQGIESKYLSALDKLEKIGQEAVIKEIVAKGLPYDKAKDLYNKIANSPETENLKRIRVLFKEMGYPDESLIFNPSIIRGLDYYTGMIFEVKLKKIVGGSLAGGGRWDEMIGKFTGNPQPAVGFSLGLERTMDALEEAGLLDLPSTISKVLVTIFNPDLAEKSTKISSLLRSNNINTELWLDSNSKLEKQLKYADKKGILFAVIIGPDEVLNNKYLLKDLKTGTQTQLSLDQLIQKLSF